VNPVEAVSPAELTVTMGMKVPAIADSLAIKESVPEGFVSVDA